MLNKKTRQKQPCKLNQPEITIKRSIFQAKEKAPVQNAVINGVLALEVVQDEKSPLFHSLSFKKFINECNSLNIRLLVQLNPSIFLTFFCFFEKIADDVYN